MLRSKRPAGTLIDRGNIHLSRINNLNKPSCFKVQGVTS